MTARTNDDWLRLLGGAEEAAVAGLREVLHRGLRLARAAADDGFIEDVTQDDEIGCDDWLGYAPSYAELVAARQPVPEPLQKAAEHLGLCPECAEEFRALLAALKGDGAGS